MRSRAASPALIFALSSILAATSGGCLRTHTISVARSELLPRLYNIDRQGAATLPGTDVIDGATDRTHAVQVRLTRADTAELPTGHVRLDALARICLAPTPALSGPDPCVLRSDREGTLVVRRTTDRDAGPVVVTIAASAVLGGLLFGGLCVSGACDGSSTVKHTGEIVGGVALTATIGVLTWALFRCLTGETGCRD